MQLHTLRTERLAMVEQANTAEVNTLKSQLASAGDKLAALSKTMDLLERRPDDEHEIVQDALHFRRISDALRLQRQRDIHVARSYTITTAAVAALLAACAVGALFTLAYYVPTMPTTSAAPAGRRSLAVANPTVVAWTKLCLDLMACVLVVILLVREFRNRRAPNNAPGSDPSAARFRELQELLRALNSIKEKQRLLGERSNGEVSDDQPRRRSCWRAVLLRLLDEHADRPTTSSIEDTSVEDGMRGLEKEIQEQEQRLRTPEIDDLEARIADILEHFGFITSTDGSVSVASQLVEQYVLGKGGNRNAQDVRLLVFIGTLFFVSLILDSIGVGVSGDAAATFASTTVSAGETCTITGDTLGGMVRAQLRRLRMFGSCAYL